MQELRFVLIVVGVLAIAALLFHGLWTSKKEGKAKFGNKPLGKLDVDPELQAPAKQEHDVALEQNDDEDVENISRKERKEPAFGFENAFDNKFVLDPLIDDVVDVKQRSEEQSSEVIETNVEHDVPPAVQEPVQASSIQSNSAQPTLVQPVVAEEVVDIEPMHESPSPRVVESDTVTTQAIVEEPKPEPEMQVIVLNVHCAGEEPFVGTKLFDSMQQNGLIYGEMNIFHRHVDLSGNGKVLFSVANMMHPGTLEHDDPAEFTTKGISFFMTLPCYGEAEQNFNLMLRSAQQIADDMGGNVLDDQRNLMTPDRLASYRRQIVEFNAANA